MSETIEIQSWLDTHDKPFMIIDQDFRIVGVNRAFEEAYGLKGKDILGKPCYGVAHQNERPCYEMGEDCPYHQVYHTGKPHTCLHIHHDAEGKKHLVRIRVFTLKGADGRVYVGELLEEMAQKNETLPEEVRLVGHSQAFLKTLEQLELAARSDAPVLLLGETGTGKELAARYVHRHSHRRKAPFIPVDCTALSESLFEAELFGHERGAFTGSVGSKPGLFEVADKGTVFLDEIGEMPLSLQPKLLRILEMGEFRRVGGRKVRKVDVRIICATNRHLWDEVKAGRFRQDLYYRIACFCIHMPPLRERLEDIPDLAEALLASISQALGYPLRLTPEAIQRLQHDAYPGNIRELRNILQRAAIFSEKGLIDMAALEKALPKAQSSKVMETPEKAPIQPSRARPLSPLEALEAQYILSLLERHTSRREVAKTLGISERTLYRKLRRYGLR